jgi:hypothetical protein
MYHEDMPAAYPSIDLRADSTGFSSNQKTSHGQNRAREKIVKPGEEYLRLYNGIVSLTMR